MALDSKHPLYEEFFSDWEMMRDLYRGERVVKSGREKYLPATQGMKLDGMKSTTEPGYIAYQAYLTRAVFHDYVREAVEMLIGLMHQKPPTIELPAKLEPLRLNATQHGETLELLLRKINEEQLITGRVGLLADFPENPVTNVVTPYIAMYIAEAIVNWDDGSSNTLQDLNFVVLNESGLKRTEDFEWEIEKVYRVLQLGDLEGYDSGTYLAGVFREQGGGTPMYNAAEMKPPTYLSQTIKKIPFVFANSKDIVSTPDDAPLNGLGRLTLAIYRGEADYRQNLFMQGQDTLVVIGNVSNPSGIPGQDGDAIRTGAGSRIDLDIGGDAKYVGVNSQGLSEQRQAIENDKKKAEQKASNLINPTNSQQESGEALKTRIAAQTATLNQIALAGAAALEKLLKIVAEWMGADANAVKVTPNLEFADLSFNAQNLTQLMSARSMGAPISLESIHAYLAEKGLSKLTFEEEMSKIEQEDAMNNDASNDAGTGGTGGNDNDTVDD